MGARLLMRLMGWSVALVGISGAVRGVCGPGRVFGAGCGGPVSWAGQGQFDIYFCVFFDCCCRSLFSGGRDWALGSTQI